MNLYIDCEWNGTGGELISMALVSENGVEWYESIDFKFKIDSWVLENVIPKVDKRPIPYRAFQDSLEAFLLQFETVHIVADWPEDVARLCNSLITGPGERLNTPPITFEILRVDTFSDNPHNALEDARGLARHFRVGVFS